MKQFAYFDAPRRGTLRRVDYVGAHGARKYALVYLPWGYETERERRYDILYLMHGGGGSPDAWPDACPVKNMLDRAFAAGEAEPMIVVFPSFYADGPRRGAPGTVDADFERKSVLTFQTEELTERLLPAVEGAVRGFAEGVSPAALKAARRHRGFGGFSMGGVNTWYAFSLHLDYFSTFLPLSGRNASNCKFAGYPVANQTNVGYTSDRMTALRALSTTATGTRGCASASRCMPKRQCCAHHALSRIPRCLSSTEANVSPTIPSRTRPASSMSQNTVSPFLLPPSL